MSNTDYKEIHSKFWGEQPNADAGTAVEATLDANKVKRTIVRKLSKALRVASRKTKNNR